jgi:uncharacterized protein YyaL (SSP411 family)
MPNQLAAESSPYLRQHADNPVEWFPWGDGALAAARERDVPILLSIGYASCHWCHVMAHESFEDAGTAAYMNEHFVNVKVDREERPDIDAVYMEAAQAISGHGGWPLTVFLTPDQVPFFAGTYFPPEPRPSMPSFKQVMKSIDEAWTTQRDEIEEQRERMVAALSTTAKLQAPEDPITDETLDAARSAFDQTFDPQFGGFGGAPKFPPHSAIDFLLGQHDERSRELALQTLDKMAAGGIHDQIGGGFSRYSVDERWHIPHFEKMLYDNALLARNYLHAFQVTGEQRLAAICRSTLDWMLREMSTDDGGFASALDADSIDADGHSEEGAFYAWEIDELREVIESAAPGHIGDFFTWWGVIDHGEFEGKNVLFINAPERMPPPEIVEEVKLAILRRREQRHRPGRDDKRIASWNALALAALAEVGAVLGDDRYLRAAVACAEFIERELQSQDGRLLRSTLDGQPGPPAYLEDHAYVAAAYLTLYESIGDPVWFNRARELADFVLEHFEDAEHGGFFSVADDQEQLIVRRKDIEDSPIPGSNSATALMLLRLHALTGEQRYRDAAARTLRILQKVAARFPSAFGHALQGIDFYLGPVDEIAVVGSGADELLSELRSAYSPRSVLAISADASEDVPLLIAREPVEGAAAAYVCRNFACERPVTSAEELADLLNTAR